MKRFLMFIAVFISVIFIDNVYAKDESRYIVKTKNHEVSLMSLDENIINIGENLYLADSLEVIKQTFNEGQIEAVFPDGEMELFELDYPEITDDEMFDEQWYLDKIGAVEARKRGLTGKNVKIAIIDSGLNANHTDIDKNNILQGYNCIIGAKDIYDFSDKVGHGTMVAGVIAAQTDNEQFISGIASEAQIIPIKITDKNSLYVSNLINGFEKALSLDCDIINMSLGGSRDTMGEEAMAVFWEYIKKAEERGIVVVAAVGNSAHTDNVMNYPAGFENVIGVGSVGEDLGVTYFSQKNDSVFVAAPGNNILTLSNSEDLVFGTGTSLSTPIVTAAIALMKEANPKYTPADIRNILMETSTDMGVKGYDTSYGYGLLNIGGIMERVGVYIPNIIITQGIINNQPRLHIHNNSDSIFADAYFVSHEGDKIKELSLFNDITLDKGVYNIVFDDKYGSFFLWDNNLRPYAGKYSIKH